MDRLETLVNPPVPAAARWALAGLSLSMLMPALDTSIANVALPAMAEAFAAPFQQVQWIVLAYLLAITSLVVGAGRLGDIVGRRRLLLGGIVLFTAASALCGLAPSLWVLIAARAVQGLGAAVMMALTVALAGEAVAKAKTGSAMGLLGTMSAIGTTLGPSLGGMLIAGFGWRSIFLVNVPVGIVNFILAHRYLPADHAPAERIRFDIAGTLLLVLTLAAYALAMTAGEGRFGLFNAALVAAAIVGLALFVMVERRSSAPLLHPGLFRDAKRSTAFATSALVSTVVMATLVVGPFYLSRALGLAPAYVGLAMSAGPLMAALSGVPAGRLVDRFGAPRMTLMGLAGMAAGCLLLAILPARLGVAGYVMPILIVTAHYALFQAANNTAVMSNVGSGQRGVVSGMLNLSRNLGLISGASVMGAVFALSSGVSQIATAAPAAVAVGMHTTFAVSAILLIAALAVVSHRR